MPRHTATGRDFGFHGADAALLNDDPSRRLQAQLAENLALGPAIGASSEILQAPGHHTTATFTLNIGGSESNRQSHFSPPSRPIHN